ncbi:MAG TPA: mycothiol synthase [Acidimicrobiales bacterium]|jgi:mycothiol synthase|nr:mycothiol synthase [Acidimicrobiales bacterium]
MDVVALSELDAPRRDAVTTLLRRADAADEHPPLPEPQYHALADGGGTNHEGRLVLDRSDSTSGATLNGFALLTPARDGSTAIHVVTDPHLEDRNGRASELVGAAVALADQDGTGPLHLWAMQAGPADDERAERYGFTPERDVIQMRVPLPLADDVLDATRPLVTRPFVPGEDDEAWLRVNNRAFAGHPEQGSWTPAQLHERLGADWVDLEGFLVADDPDGEGLIGFCWTKIHRTRSPVLGEIYVIGVDPAHHGGGLGRALTVAGLNSMADRGVHVGMLYTDDSNEAAVALYGRLGFKVDHVDRSYRRTTTATAAPEAVS